MESYEFLGDSTYQFFFSALTVYGLAIVEWLYVGFSADQATLNRFYSFHFFLPFFIYGFVFAHIGLVHESDSNNPLGLGSNIKYVYPSTIPFFPSFFVKDLICSLVLATIILFLFLLFLPQALVFAEHYIYADPLVTPAPLVPKWYFLPFYAILRSIPNKLGVVVVMVFSILGFFYSINFLCL